MSILDIFKKKASSAKALEDKKKKEKAKLKPKIKVEAEKPKKKVLPKKIKEKRFKMAYRVLKSPHITEKATNLTQKNQYIFKVWPKTSKTEIKKAIKEVFRKDVVSVRTIKISRKKRRMGKISGWKPGYKKAIVKLKEGQKIEVLPR
jgi:large subunit ribosomal protein L23